MSIIFGSYVIWLYICCVYGYINIAGYAAIAAYVIPVVVQGFCQGCFILMMHNAIKDSTIIITYKSIIMFINYSNRHLTKLAMGLLGCTAVVAAVSALAMHDSGEDVQFTPPDRRA